MSNSTPGHDRLPGRRSMSWGFTVTLVVLGMLAGGGAALVVESRAGGLRVAAFEERQGSSERSAEAPSSPSTDTSTPGEDPSSAGPTPDPSVTSSTDVEPSPDNSPSVRPSSPQDPPSKDGADASVVRSSAGSRCTTLDEKSSWGGYPLARCTLWQPADGHLYGESVSKGATTVTCQRDLGVQNPVYKEGQNNTWWVWATSDVGTWDWYPETAVQQGVADQPINGIALCKDDS